MITVRVCRYCSRPVGHDERAAVCGRCYSEHHEACWERNGRCSTFRCPGLPQTMSGAEVLVYVRAAMEGANQQPEACPFCGSPVHAGTLQGKRSGDTKSAGPGLQFVARDNPNASRCSLGRRLVSKVLGPGSWFLPGAAVRARSCGKCHRLFLWGTVVGDSKAPKPMDRADPHFCPHCANELWPGQLALRPHTEGARFVCDEVPDFHRDWFGHNVLDRFLLSRWNVAAKAVPAASCPDCLYTEVDGRPVYHFE